MTTDYVLARPRSERPVHRAFAAEDYADVGTFFDGRADLHPTPVHRLRGLARDLGLAGIMVKDETGRFGLDAFKVVGVTYAVHRMLDRGDLDPDALLVCASAGNHGRAVARVARDTGQRARVYLPAGTAASRIEAIEGEGAEVVVSEGGYDQAVSEALADAESRETAVFVSDTARPGHTRIPRMIMLGYARILEEARRAWDDAGGPPDVVLVQAGVGALAGAVAGWLTDRYGSGRPYVIVGEPTDAACVLLAVREGRPVALDGDLRTSMVGLRAGRVSPVAWPALEVGIDACVAIPDAWSFRAMRRLARPVGDDPAVVAGSSGACGLAALLAIMSEPALERVREAARLGPAARAFVIVTEGPTDPELAGRVLAETDDSG